MNRKLKFASLVILSIVCSLTSVFAHTSLIERLFPGSSTAFARWLPAGPLATKTWDGGGATNNWSEAANWSGDTVPAPTDDVIFDATSAKNATLDTNVAVRSITIGTGYTGTLTQGASAIVIQSNGFGAFTQRGGTFDGGTGDITLTGDANFDHDFVLTGGTFNSTSGTLFLSRSFRHTTGGTFNANGGTVTFNDAQNITFNTTAIPAGDVFNNLTIAKTGSVTIEGKAIATGAFVLNDGQFVSSGGSSLGSFVEARGTFSISPNYDGGRSRVVIANGAAPRAFTFTAGLNLPSIVLNDPQATIDTGGAGTLNFPFSFILQQGTFNQGAVDLDFFPSFGDPNGACLALSGGTFNASGHAITVTSDGSATFVQSGGTFNGGTGDITLTGDANAGHDFVLTGGTFNSTSGTLFLSRSFRHTTGGTFNANGGTVTFNDTQQVTFETSAVPAGDVFNNLVFAKANQQNTFTVGKALVTGSLALDDGQINSSGGGFENYLEARGAFTISPNFDGGRSRLVIAGGSGARNFTFAGGINYPNILLNDPQTTIDTAGGPLDFPNGFVLQQGTFNQGAADLNFLPSFNSALCYTQSGGTFNGSSHPITFTSNGSNAFVQSGGTFNGGSGDITLTGDANADHDLSLTGGTFNSTSATLVLTRGFRHQTGGTFNANGGTVRFTSGNTPGVTALNDTFNNLIVEKDHGSTLFINGIVTVAGQLSLIDGTITDNAGALQAAGDTTVAATFDGGNIGFTFTGAANQSFTNQGAPNFSNTWTLNKSGGTVTLGSDLDLGNGTNPLFLTNGTITTGLNFTVNAATRTINRTNGWISGNLRKNFTTTGTRTYDVGTNNAYKPVTANITALAAGTQGLTIGEFQGAHPNLDPATSLARFWKTVEHGDVTATLTFGYVDPLDIQGSETAYRFAEIDSVVRFFSNAAVPINRTANTFALTGVTDFKTYTLGEPHLVQTPANTSVVAAQTRTFVGSGAVEPYAYSLQTNLSGASINPATGLYTAGTLAGVVDTVRVTDAENRIFNSTVTVLPDAASKVKFTVQPANSQSDAPIAPAVKAAIEDQFGNLVTTATDPVTVAIAANPSGGTLSGTLTQNAAGGVATFSDLAIDRAGNGYTLAAASGALAPDTSSAFNVIGPFKLAFLTPPANAQPGRPITPAVQVAVEDQFGNTVASADNAVTIALADNPAGGALGGTLTRSAVGGVASFDNLTLDRIGTGYTLSATSPRLISVTSGAFDVAVATVVTNTNDSGEGSLRQAILNANGAPGPQTVSFNIPGSAPFVIQLQSSLPPITDPAIIDATTQPGYGGTPMVEIDGVNRTANSAFQLAANDSAIKGFSIVNALKTIYVTGSNNTLKANWVGISPAGANIGATDGITIWSSQNNLIGGPAPGDRNVIGGVTVGIYLLNSDSNTVQGNYSGTDPAGLTAFSNTTGIHLFAGSDNNLITDNLVSGNRGGGVIISEGVPTSNNNTVQNNIIGLNAAGTATLPNNYGITEISNHDSGNRFTQNRIFGNRIAGIRLGVPRTSPLLNDPQDLDTGSNTLQNHPVLAQATSNGSSTAVSGQLNSTPSQAFTAEFFSSPNCAANSDASFFGQGETYLGSATLTTDATGIAPYNLTFPVSGLGRYITATATDANGNTSEFSRCLGVSPAVYSISGRITNGGQPAANVIVNLNGAGVGGLWTMTNSNGDYSFTQIPETSQAVSVTPASSTLNFTPAAIVYANLIENKVNQDFAASPKNFSVSGKIKAVNNGSATPLGGVTVNLTGAANRTTQTDANGNYKFTNVAAGAYTVAPARPSFTFTPSATPVNVAADQTVDFTAQPNPPLDGRIVFTREGSLLYGMNADGSGLATLQSPANSRSSLSTDGRRILVLHNSLPCLVNYDGSGLSCLNNLPVAAGEPALSPDGTRIAFVKVISPYALFTANADGTNVRQIINEGAHFIRFPVWSPDGAKILYDLDYGSTLKTVNADGTNPRLVATGIGSGDWSPDGTKILGVRPNRSLVTMNADGTNQTVVIAPDPLVTLVSKPAWSPDGQRFVFARLRSGVYQIVTAAANGTNQTVVYSDGNSTAFSFTPDWGTEPANVTNPGTNVAIASGAVTITFGTVAGAGQTSVVPIPPASAGTTPHGFSLGAFGAYEISTTATVAPPITVCFNLPASVTLTQFNQLKLMHNEGGVLLDRTSSKDFPARKICGTVTSLSPFAVAEEIDPGRPSITGLVQDSNGNPLAGVSVNLTGAENRTTATDSDGLFMFPNLTAGANYNVRPQSVGSLFTEYSQDFVNLNGENPVVFTGAAAAFGISGRVTDAGGNGVAGVQLALGGDNGNVAFTDASGNYSFANLPADASCQVTPSNNQNAFAPAVFSVNALTGDVDAADFTMLAPTAAAVAVRGRVADANGQAIPRALVSMTGPDGARRAVRTNSFGYYVFDDVAAGETYVFAVRVRDRRFEPRVVSVTDNLEDLDFAALP